jgi:hypothetical protein
MDDAGNRISRSHAFGQFQKPFGERRDRRWRANLVAWDPDDVRWILQKTRDEILAIAKQPGNAGNADARTDGKNALRLN